MAQNNEDGPTSAKRPMINEDLTQNVVNIDKKLVRMICLDLHPTDISNCKGFRKFFEDLLPHTTLPTEDKLVKELIPQEYKQAKLELRKMLQSVHHVAITTDIWTWMTEGSPSHDVKMWTITIHFIYQGELISQTLFSIEEKESAALIASAIKLELNEWGILKKVVCFVISHKNTFLEKLVTKELGIPYIFCAASSINLVMQEGFSYLYIEKAYQTKYTFLTKLSINFDKPFSWHKHYTELQSQLNNFTEPDKNAIAECLQMLKSFEITTNALSSQKYQVLSFVITLILAAEKQILECSASTILSIDFKKKILMAISSYFRHYENDHTYALKASFMDPRFKSVILNHRKRDVLFQELIEELYEGVKSTQQRTRISGIQTANVPDPQTPGPSTSNNDEEQNGTTNNSTQLLDYLNEKEKYARQHSMLTYYKDLPPPTQVPTSANPFQYWVKHFKDVSDTTVSEFYRMFEKYLCIPATAQPVEAFNGNGYIYLGDNSYIDYNARRKLLTRETLNEVLFLHSYYCRNM